MQLTMKRLRGEEEEMIGKHLKMIMKLMIELIDDNNKDNKQ